MCPVWNSEADDLSGGFDLVDYETGALYSEKEALDLPSFIRRRLTVHWRRKGAWVMTTEEGIEVLKRDGVWK